MPDVINKMRDDLGASKEVSLGDLFIRFEEKNGAKALQKLTEKTLGDVYGNRRIATRSIAGSSLALWALGPAGALTSASLYTLYARKTMASLARREIATTLYNDLRVSARTRLRTAKAEIENSVKLGTRTQDEAKKLIDDLQRQSDLLETQGRLLESQLDNAVLKSP